MCSVSTLAQELSCWPLLGFNQVHMHTHGEGTPWSEEFSRSSGMPGAVLATARPLTRHFCHPAVGTRREPDSAVSLRAGKSALHWAAAVNNVEATLALLKNGANKDMQDSKVSP